MKLDKIRQKQAPHDIGNERNILEVEKITYIVSSTIGLRRGSGRSSVA